MMQSMCNSVSFVTEEKKKWILFGADWIQSLRPEDTSTLFFNIDCSNQYRGKKLRALRFEEKMVSKMISKELWSCSATLSEFYPLFFFHFLVSLSLSVFHFYFTASRRMEWYNLNHPPEQTQKHK